jgi:autotransporter adhesin
VADMIASATGGGTSGPMVFAARNLAAAAPDAGSGVDSSALTTSYKTAAYYSQVSGLGDNAGLTGPSDMARAAGAGSIAIGSNAYTPGINGVAVGVQAYTSANDAVALGSGSVANKANTVSVGNDGTSSYTAYDSNGNPYTIQNQVNTRRIVNMAAGQDDTDAVNVSQLRGALNAIGGGAAVNADGSIKAPTFVVGGTTVNTVSAAITNLDARVTQNTAAIASLEGGSSTASAQSTVLSSAPTRLAASQAGVSDSASTTDADAVHYDSSAHDSVTLSSATGGSVKLSGLTNADLSADSTDAVTGQQLYATNQQLNTLSQSVQNIGTTGSTAVATNTISGAAAASGTQSVAVGGGAVATGNNATAIGDKANASANNSVAIGANSIANRANAVSVGAEGSERQIVNVAAGTSGTDAVNLNQLNDAMSQQSNTFNQQITGLQNSINTVSKNAYAGVAAAMAMPNLTPSGPGRVVVAAGGGYYMGGSAAAVGATYRSQNMRWLVNGGVSVTNTGTAAVRAQVGYEF